MNSAPVSIKMLLIPLKSAVATNARRHELSAAASSELAGCCRWGRGSWLIRIGALTPWRSASYHDRAAKLTGRRRFHRALVYDEKGRFPAAGRRLPRVAKSLTAV